MDIRCGSCNKLFRVSDDKISGKGIRFKCSRCGETITVTREDVAASLSTGPAMAPETAPPAPRTAPPAAAEPAPRPKPQTAPEPPAREFPPQEYQPPVPPTTGMEDFDFSEPHAAAASASTSVDESAAGGESFSFDAPAEGAGTEAGSEAEAGGEFSFSEEEEKEAESSLQFPDDIISEPARKPAFASAPAAEEQAQPEAEPGGESGFLSKAPVAEKPAPELTIPEEPGPEPETKKKAPQPVAAAGPIFTPPARPPYKAEEKKTEEEIDLGQALAIPKTVTPGPAAGTSRPAAAKAAPAPARIEEERDLAAAEEQASNESVHPLASGNVTGAIAGLGCAVPVVLLLLFAFSMVAGIMPRFSAFPRYHLLVVIGTGLVGLGVMTGAVIAVVQAQAGKKLFFLLNVLVGAVFGLMYGAGMNAVTGLASGAGLNPGGIIMGALSGGAIAFLLSLLIVLARRIMYFTREESFAAPLPGLQKAGIALSLLVILASLYAEGTLMGSMEKAAQNFQQQFEESVSPQGLTVVNAQGYLDPATGDLVISGSVRNDLDTPKEGWYLEVDVYNQDQKLLSTVKMLNGVQLLDTRDLEILATRGKNVEELKAGMVMAFQGGTIPEKASVQFEVHLMGPPQGIASFYPNLREFSFRDVAKSVPGVE